MKQIIVPLDFSAESKNGLELAIMIASKTKANIQMVYVLKSSSDFSHSSKEEEQRFAKAKFKELQAKYEHKLPSGVKLSYKGKRGKIYDKIETLFFNCRKHFIELDKLKFELIQTKKENQNKINLIFNKINSILNREEISINEKLFYTFTPNKIKRSLTN